MYVFCEFKQKSFDEACCSFANSENMEQIARDLGMKPGMLRNKLNPAQPHALKPVELIAVSKVSGNYTLINCLLLGLDMVAAPVLKEEDEKSMMERLLHNSANAGELSTWALEHGNNARLSRTHKQSLIQKAQAGIGNLVLLINDVENRTTGGLQPLMQFGTDLIVSGVPLPGLA
ncbi:phage regulatory CII family protein [Vibrio cyclitrophicus]|uniref:phage regulatory CII family protein n=1 Tax=Vibrio cyclitrophicus TaxID=47951 RepID=UPI00037444FF|nr:phage regulatory CII family protein [Vibrio cyclitrophicus]